MIEPGRKFVQNAKKYRFNFNGKELDNESPIQYDYGFRIYDPRLGRFKSLDPLQKKFPELTPYQFASNSPIANVDLDGKEAEYYTKTIIAINYYKCGNVGWVLDRQEQKVIVEGIINVFLAPNGALGSGTMYTIQSQTADIYGDGTDEMKANYSKPLVVQMIYKLSEADEMKADISKRPMFSGKYQLLVLGNGSDNSESPGERANPNAVTETIDMKAFKAFMEPILIGVSPKSPIDYHPPTLEDLVNKQVKEAIRKAEDAQKMKENKPDANVTYCETCKHNVRKDKEGKMTFDSSGVQHVVPGDTSTNHGAEPNRKTKQNNEN
jgi:RHS repeat-associated protein